MKKCKEPFLVEGKGQLRWERLLIFKISIDYPKKAASLYYVCGIWREKGKYCLSLKRLCVFASYVYLPPSK